jgi:hypothetical protein
MNKEERDRILKELCDSIECMAEVSVMEDSVKLEKQKCQKRLQLARQELNSIEF